MMLVLQTVFSTVFKTKIVNFPVYAMAGILFWNFFSQSVVSSMNSLRGNAQILKKVPVPKEIFPISTVISGVLNLIFALVPLLLILIITGHPLTPALFFLPVSILIAAVFTLGAGLLLSPLSVFFSDVIEMITVLLSVLMYLTPIFYPKDIVPEHMRWIVRYNPIRSILEVFRDPIYYGKVPPLTHLTVSVLITLIIFAIGAFAFRRSSDRIPFYI
jgi:ABC-2 type transport system permease protein